MGCMNKLINRFDSVRFLRSVFEGEWRDWVFIKVVRIRVFLKNVVNENSVLKVVVMI